MKLRTDKIVIPKEEPFKNDLLERKQYADVLTQIVMNTTGGFTLSINADWGYGKTTFVKMWEASLQNEGYQTIYFNAWETDFVADPMMALIDGLREGFDSKDLPQEKLQLYQAVWKAATKLVQLVPQVKVIGEIAEMFQNGINECLEDKNKLQEHQSYQKLIKEFKDQLTNFANAIDEDKQLIIFVDELDRCRPDYAVQMLERIKHFFSIENIIFVLSIDKEVISESIKTVYGDIDVAGYLRRFVDLEFNLPEPSVDDFIKAQYTQHRIQTLFSAYWEQNRKNYGGQAMSDKLLELIQICFTASKHSLRDVEKYFNRLDVVSKSLNLEGVPLEIVVFILYLYIFRQEIYNKYRLLEYSILELWEILQKDIESSKLITTDNDNMYWYRDSIISVLVFYVCLQMQARKKDKIIDDICNHGDCSWLPIDYQQQFIDSYNTLKRFHNKTDLFTKIEFVSANFNWRVVKGVMDT